MKTAIMVGGPAHGRVIAIDRKEWRVAVYPKRSYNIAPAGPIQPLAVRHADYRMRPAGYDEPPKADSPRFVGMFMEARIGGGK